MASDQVVPGRTGGSVHVLEVARGLGRRGHELHAVIGRGGGEAPQLPGVRWHRVAWFPKARVFRFRARGAVEKIAASVHPDVVMERYYNFAGEGVQAAKRAGIPSLLEVNSPVVDHPGSLKAVLDGLLVVRPMRRYRERLCREAGALVSPMLEIVPSFARAKTEVVTWGANVDAFQPSGDRERARREWGVPEGAVCCVFSGSFRPWHGVHVLEKAARRLVARDDIFFILAGGPHRGAARDFNGRYLGRVPYERMPSLLGAADIGVAPYDTERLSQLRLGFYWSPLKIFEYMAAGVPTLTISRPPLDEIVRHEREGLHFVEADASSLGAAITRLADERELARELGRNARSRVVERYSWERHCEQLENVLRTLAA